MNDDVPDTCPECGREFIAALEVMSTGTGRTVLEGDVCQSATAHGWRLFVHDRGDRDD